mgnify:CR=1 FL=1
MERDWVKTDQGGVNARILAKQTKADFRRIEVVNSFGAQGRVFTGGAAECKAIGKLTMDQVNQEFLPEHTSLWSAPSN